MLIPSIDLMNGKIVQLIQGERKALEFSDFSEWIQRVRSFPIVQVIDLDAAMGTGSNAARIKELCGGLCCQVGGGLRSTEAVRQALARGAKKAIIGSSLFSQNGVDLAFAQALADEFDPERLIFAVDSRNGFVSVKGWKQSTRLRPVQGIRELGEFCSAFLYTHIDSEGTMSGFPFSLLPELQGATSRRLIVAGGIATAEEVDRLDKVGIDAVVGMAIYTGSMQI